jgi:hypothetical protein
MLTELLRREKESNVEPDPDIDAYMKVRIKAPVWTGYLISFTGICTCETVCESLWKQLMTCL